MEFENEWLWQAVFRKFIYSVQEGKGCSFSCDCLSLSPSSLGVTLKGKNLLPWGANSFPFKVTPNFKVIQLASLKPRIKMIFFYLSEGMKNVKCQGKIREKSRNFEVKDKWQPCYGHPVFV